VEAGCCVGADRSLRDLERAAYTWLTHTARRRWLSLPSVTTVVTRVSRYGCGCRYDHRHHLQRQRAPNAQVDIHPVTELLGGSLDDPQPALTQFRRGARQVGTATAGGALLDALLVRGTDDQAVDVHSAVTAR
jgi:hypothetical protein